MSVGATAVTIAGTIGAGETGTCATGAGETGTCAIGAGATRAGAIGAGGGTTCAGATGGKTGAVIETGVASAKEELSEDKTVAGVGTTEEGIGIDITGTAKVIEETVVTVA